MYLERYEYNDVGTFGSLHLPDGSQLAVLEPPWIDNGPFVSCVPEGKYVLVPHNTEKYPDTWALVGKTVSQWPSKKERYAIVFHSGNFSTDTAGCLLVAEYRDGFSVLNSSMGAGMEKLRLALMAENLLPDLVIMNISGREVVSMAVSDVETTPSAPRVGAARDLTRTISGWIVSLVLAGLAKIGLGVEISDEIFATIVVITGSIVVSPILAWLGKTNRQDASPTALRGTVF